MFFEEILEILICFQRRQNHPHLLVDHQLLTPKGPEHTVIL